MKENKTLNLTEKKKSGLSRHLITFVAGANIVLGSLTIPQITHAAVTNKDTILTKKSVLESVYVYEKLDFTSPVNNEDGNTSCPHNTGCPTNTGC